MDALPLASLRDLRGALETVPVCGLLLDLSTLVTADTRDKNDTREFLELYPSEKFRLVGDEVHIVGESLEKFVDKCQHFSPRKIRTSVRVDKYLAVYLSANEAFKRAEKTTTINISDGGCFVYSTRKWKVGSRVWLKSFGDEIVISGIIRSARPWGNNEFIPGIGIQVDRR
jgi:hypothetical protein